MNSSKVKNYHQKDIDYALKIIRWLLKPLGVWPHEHVFYKIFDDFIAGLCWLLLGFIILPGLFLLIIVDSRAIKIRLTGPLSFCVMAILKYYSFHAKHKAISNSINHMIYDWKNVTSESGRNIMLEYAQLGRYGATIASVFMYFGALFYAIILPNISGNIKSNTNETIRPFAYPSYYGLFDPQVTPNYEIIFSVHIFCAYVMHTIASATCSLAVILITHACGQLEVVIMWLNNLIDKNSVCNDEMFSQIIQHHIRTLRFIDNIEDILCFISLVEIGGCTLNICLIGYDLLLQWGQSDPIGIMTYSILFTSFTFNNFLFCYIGELLLEECKKVGNTTYLIDWYHLPPRKALQLIFIISTSQNPPIITAGKIINLSLNSFATVMRTSFAYLNMLRTFME